MQPWVSDTWIVLPSAEIENLRLASLIVTHPFVSGGLNIAKKGIYGQSGRRDQTPAGKKIVRPIFPFSVKRVWLIPNYRRIREDNK